MKDVSFKNRNLLVLIFEVFLIIIAIGGLTFATSRLLGASTIVIFGEYDVDYIGETEIVVDNLEPISDSMINYDTENNVIRLEFSLRGVESNGEEELIYDVMLNEMNIDCSLLNEYTKWNLYKNGELLYNGNFSPKYDGNILTDNYRFTEIQQSLPKYNEDYDKYVLIIWISEACEDLATCVKVDQSNIVNSSMDMNVFIAVSGGEKVQYTRVGNDRATCVNKPILSDGMIPVYFDNGEVYVADKTNSDVDKLWYDYGDAKWANVVLVSGDKYNDAVVGMKVDSLDVLAYYVWIPRFKYKLWTNGEDITDSYNAYEKGIDIVFESGGNTTGQAVCSLEKCSRYNEYLTHPAFSNSIKGFWISKYEVSEGGKFIAGVDSLKNNSYEDYKNIMNDLTVKYNLSGNIESHMVNNLEWGATLYLSHSKYGICQNNECLNSKIDSTTGNVFGVYDMAYGTAEYVDGTIGIGSAISEVRVSLNETWDNGFYVDNFKDYKIRGGEGTGMYHVRDIEMFDVSSRSTLIIK